MQQPPRCSAYGRRRMSGDSPVRLTRRGVNRFKEQINEDLNMPRALAVVWELVKGDLSPSIKKATLLQFDRVLGLRLAEWQPAEEIVPGEIMALVDERQKARSEKRWKDADALREQVRQAGYEIEDTPKGPKIKPARQERS